MRADKLSEEHLGMKVVGIPGLVVWQDRVVLDSIYPDDDSISLRFCWPKTGTFAVGATVSADMPVEVHPFEVVPDVD